ncbi:MAG: hypothetical protein R3B99_01350 [Polyangiales bacterium]
MRRLPYGFLLLLLAFACGDDDTPDMDASTGRDAGERDAAPADASVPDGGTPPDAPLPFDAGPLREVSLTSDITRVQPMTGLVLWEESWNGDAIKTSDAIALEYAYVRPSSIVTARDTYDWSGFDAFLDRIAGRGHQAVVRFYYVYPGEETAVPDYLKALPDYDETVGSTEGMRTVFPDWTHEELRRFHLQFYERFAARYDDDPRIAFLQTGFGLWGEYHIYDGPRVIGETFPSEAFQAEFVRHLDAQFDTLHWSLSIDAAADEYSPFANDAALRALDFGLFDDSFMHEEHAGYNEASWGFFGYARRYERSPHGGELSYYSDFDQEHALDVAGIYGRTYEELSARFHVSYMIGNDQPEHQSDARIREAGLANGYKFEVLSFRVGDAISVVEVRNFGVAPIYYDAFVAVNGVRSTQSLKGLLPGQVGVFTVASGGDDPVLTIECDRLVAGQRIEFRARL